jgi:hypothetical protein
MIRYGPFTLDSKHHIPVVSGATRKMIFMKHSSQKLTLLIPNGRIIFE